jgi:hypothetical protein
MRNIVIALSLVAFTSVSGQTLSTEKQEAINTFIRRVKTAQIDSLAAHTSFPLGRNYPIPAIADANDFIARFNDVFDSTLIKMIAESNPAIDWSEVGWRGIMLGNGQVWLEDDGTLKAVNYQSAFEKQKKSELIARDKAQLHESLRQFSVPLYLLETKTYRIRIDEITPGNYRYASWKLDKPMSDKPDLVINGGKLEHRGSGGNHDITFKKGQFTYVCDIIILGEDESPGARLYIYKTAKEIMVQDATIILK